jgi:glycosyltransferase involved in cell wall biosynthesis
VRHQDRERDGIDVLLLIIDVKLTLENSPVFQTQVGGQALALREAGFSVSLLCTTSDRARFDVEIGNRLRDAGVRVSLVRHGSLPGNLLRIAAALRKQRRTIPLGRVYLRGIWGYLALCLAFPWRRPEHVYDVRGALLDESSLTGTPGWRVLLYAALEHRAIARARAVTAVSDLLADHLRRRFRRSAVEVIPSCVHVAELESDEAVRAESRDAYGFSADDVVLVYCGGLNRWQKIPEMLALWSHLLDDTDARFLLITTDQPNDGAIVSPTGEFGDRLVQLRLPHADVPRTLAAADIGFMLRDNRPLNQMASPVKFAEYLAAGLSVVASPGVGDISRLIERERIGVLVDPADPVSGASAVRELMLAVRKEGRRMRRAALDVARSNYDWAAYRPAFHRLYGDANSQRDEETKCAAL